MTMNADDFSLDELASAYLDNEVTPDERARAESDPTVMARVAAFRSLDAQFRADLTADLPVVAATQDDMIGRALGLFDTGVDAGVVAGVDIDPELESPAVSPPPAAVVPLLTRRRRLTAPWTTIAVAAAVLGGLVILGRSISPSGEDAQSESATQAAATTAAAVEAATAAAPAEAEIFDAAATEAPAATEAASAATEAAPARPATVVTIGSIDGGATAGDTQSTESAPPAAAESTAESTVGFAETTVVSLTLEEQLQAYVASLIGTVSDRKAAQVPTNCLVNGVAIENVSWQGLAGVLVLSPDATNPTTAEIIDSTCGVLVRVAITR